jgi:hypothetical protein
MLVVDPFHWLNEDGSIPAGNARLRQNILRVARVIEYGGPLKQLEGRETLLECRKRLKGKPCEGLLWVVKTEEDRLHAFCALCKADEMLVSNWQETEWAAGPMAPVPLSAFDSIDSSVH